MLVPGLEKSSLFTMLSGDNVDYLRVHGSLCQCAEAILDKYVQKKSFNDKLGVKILATQVLLRSLAGVSKKEDSCEIREVLSLALKNHSKALQGREHLLSERGNTYELIKQTQGLREMHATPSASLLRYHALKNKFLGADTPLDAEEKDVICELAAKKELTLKILENLEVNHRVTARTLVRLHKAGLLEPDLCAGVLECKDPYSAAEIVISRRMSGQHVEKRRRLYGVSSVPELSADIPELVGLDIEKVMEKAGYCCGPDGNMCYGLAWTGLLACIRQGGQAYMKRMQYLEKADTLPSPGVSDTYQVHPFFRNVTLNVDDYKKISKQGFGFYGRQEVTFPGHVIDSHEAGCQKVPVARHAFIAECRPETFIEFLRQTRENNKEVPFGVMINYPDYVASIGFDGKKWLAVDRYEYYYTTDMNTALYLFLRTHDFCYKSGWIIAMIEVVTDAWHFLNINKDTIAANIRKSVSVPTVLNVALQNDDEFATIECIQVISRRVPSASPGALVEQLDCRDVWNTPVFYMALQDGNYKAVNAFIRASAAAMAEFSHWPENLKAELLCELFSSKAANGVSGFFMALQKNHLVTVIGFIRVSAAVITAIHLTDERKAELLCELFSSKTSSGLPSIYNVLHNGHLEIIMAFIQQSAAAIDALDLPKERKAEFLYSLLASKLGDGSPGFYMALHEPHPDAIVTFIQASAEAMAKFGDSEEEKAKLICWLFHRLKSEDELYFSQSMKLGGQAASEAFNKGIDQLPLSVEQKETLKYTAPDSVENTVENMDTQ